MAWSVFVPLLLLLVCVTFLLGLAVSVTCYALPRPRRFGYFDVEKEHD